MVGHLRLLGHLFGASTVHCLCMVIRTFNPSSLGRDWARSTHRQVGITAVCISLFNWLVLYVALRDISLLRRRFGGRKPGCAQGKPTTIRRLHADSCTFGRGGSQHDLDLNSQRPCCWETGRPSHCDRALTDRAMAAPTLCLGGWNRLWKPEISLWTWRVLSSRYYIHCNNCSFCLRWSVCTVCIFCWNIGMEFIQPYSCFFVWSCVSPVANLRIKQACYKSFFLQSFIYFCIAFNRVKCWETYIPI